MFTDKTADLWPTQNTCTLVSVGETHWRERMISKYKHASPNV